MEKFINIVQERYILYFTVNVMIIVYQNDPLSIICVKLSSDLNVDSSQVLLQQKSSDVTRTDTPTSLNLTSVDILGQLITSNNNNNIVIDAFVLNTCTTIPSTKTQTPPTSSEICIKVQTIDRKCLSYNIGKVNPVIKHHNYIFYRMTSLSLFFKDFQLISVHQLIMYNSYLMVNQCLHNKVQRIQILKTMILLMQ